MYIAAGWNVPLTSRYLDSAARHLFLLGAIQEDAYQLISCMVYVSVCLCKLQWLLHAACSVQQPNRCSLVVQALSMVQHSCTKRHKCDSIWHVYTPSLGYMLTRPCVNSG